jgi:hypothetical protein
MKIGQRDPLAGIANPTVDTADIGARINQAKLGRMRHQAGNVSAGHDADRLPNVGCAPARLSGGPCGDQQAECGNPHDNAFSIVVMSTSPEQPYSTGRSRAGG